MNTAGRRFVPAPGAASAYCGEVAVLYTAR